MEFSAKIGILFNDIHIFQLGFTKDQEQAIQKTLNMAKTPEWLNSEFVEKVLKNAENDDTIKVKDVATKPATAKGDNYTSDMIRATVEYSRGKTGSKVTTEKKSIIIKISPTESDLHKEMVSLHVHIFLIQFTITRSLINAH